MEAFIIFLVIAALFNFVNNMVRRAKEQQGEQFRPAGHARPSASVNRLTLFAEEGHPARIIPEVKPRSEKRASFAKEIIAVKEPETSAVPGKLHPPVQAVSKKHSGNVSGALHEMLTKQDKLVAAFIFHEILERPRSMKQR